MSLPAGTTPNSIRVWNCEQPQRQIPASVTIDPSQLGGITVEEFAIVGGTRIAVTAWLASLVSSESESIGWTRDIGARGSVSPWRLVRFERVFAP